MIKVMSMAETCRLDRQTRDAQSQPPLQPRSGDQMAIKRTAQSRSNHERGACPYREHRYVPEGPSKALTHVKGKPMKRAADKCGDGTSRKTQNPKLRRF